MAPQRVADAAAATKAATGHGKRRSRRAEATKVSAVPVATAHVVSLGPIAVAGQPSPELSERPARCAVSPCCGNPTRHGCLTSRVGVEEEWRRRETPPS